MSAQAHEPVDYAAALKRAINDLPVEAHGRVWEQLAEAAAAFEQDDLAPMRRFLKSLFMTSRLYANPAYRKSVAAVADPSEEPTEIDVPALLDDIRARRT